MKRRLIIGVAAVALSFVGMFALGLAKPVEAKCAGAETSLIQCDDAADGETAISSILYKVLNFLTASLGVLGILGVIIAGIIYMTARDNENQIKLAKTRLLQISTGFIAFAAFGTLMLWLIPGGMPNGSGDVTAGNTTSGDGGGGQGSQSQVSGAGNRETGSEDISNIRGSVGSGSEGWVGQN